MPFGEIVCGSPGSGKSTYCYGKYQLFTALRRPISVVNLDPANEHIPYPCAVDIGDLITLADAVAAHALGPNGGMLYCMEYLEANFDWLAERLRALGRDAYVVFDLPGQVELTTAHESVRRIVQRLARSGFRRVLVCVQLAAVHLCDAHYVTDAAKYVSVLLLSLRTMLHLELPHVNVLSKVDLIAQYGDLGTYCATTASIIGVYFNLDFYTEVQDLSYLENALSAASPRYAALNMAITSLIEDYGLVGFETLAVEVRVFHPFVFVYPSHPLTLSSVHLSSVHPLILSPSHPFIRAVGQSIDAAPEPRRRPRDGVRLRAARGLRCAPGGGRGGGGGGGGGTPRDARANAYGLFASAAGPIGGVRSDVRDVQERWVDAREAWDAYERRAWRREGEAVREGEAAAGAAGREGRAVAEREGREGKGREGIRQRGGAE
ncbi:hypothetical protein PTI98_002303 [Pleurotus ostreatus]|nr:hypothetical protein PTI98_002303 [Pleurotus ostreatus]